MYHKYYFELNDNYIASTGWYRVLEFQVSESCNATIHLFIDGIWTYTPCQAAEYVISISEGNIYISDVSEICRGYVYNYYDYIRAGLWGTYNDYVYIDIHIPGTTKSRMRFDLYSNHNLDNMVFHNGHEAEYSLDPYTNETTVALYTAAGVIRPLTSFKKAYKVNIIKDNSYEYYFGSKQRESICSVYLVTWVSYFNLNSHGAWLVWVGRMQSVQRNIEALNVTLSVIDDGQQPNPNPLGLRLTYNSENGDIGTFSIIEL